MGEEEKKPEEKKMEEEKKTEEVKKPEEDKKKKEDAKEEKEGPDKDEKKTEEVKEAAPPPPQEIILRVFMHCEGCARKVRRCLKGFEGVENVQTDCKTHKVVVKGEKADPIKVLERVQRKSHRKVELLSPIPKPPAEETKVAEKEPAKAEEKKEPQLITVVLKVYMHCEGCAQEIKKRIQRMKGVEKAEPDLKSSQVKVEGVFDPPQLVEYVYKRTGKHAVIVNTEPEKKKDSDEKEKEGKEEKKVEEAAAPADKKDGEDAGKEASPPAEKPAVTAAETAGEKSEAAAEKEESNDGSKMVEMKNEFQYFYPHNYQIVPQMFSAEMQVHYPPAPQIFSDENPNACSVM